MAAPLVTIDNRSLRPNEWWRIKDALSYTDFDGNSPVTYQFFDSGTGLNSAYFWTPENAHHPASTYINVAAANLPSVWVRGGTSGGMETLWVRAFDGNEWSAWDAFTLTTQNTAPQVLASDLILDENQFAQPLTQPFDVDGDTVTKYQFYDAGTGSSSGYLWSPEGGRYAAGTYIDLTPYELTLLRVYGGAAPGVETMWARAFDGYDWGAWTPFTLTTESNTPPVASIDDKALHTNEWARLQDWISVSDVDIRDSAIRYQFWDSGAESSSAYFWTLDNAHHPAGAAIEVSTVDLGSVWVRGGVTPQSETMWVRAFDGAEWGAWDSFTMTTLPKSPPVATIENLFGFSNQWYRVQNLLNYTDVDGDAAIKYEFIDSGADATSGYFWTPVNAHHPANTYFEVAAADIASVWIRSNESTFEGNDVMWVRAFDGTHWSAWDPFSIWTN